MAVDFNVFLIPGGSWRAQEKERKDGLCQVTFEELGWVSRTPTGKKFGRIVGSKDDFKCLYAAIRDLLNESEAEEEKARTSFLIPGECTDFEACLNVLGGIRELKMLKSGGKEIGSITGSNYDFYHMYRELQRVYCDE